MGLTPHNRLRRKIASGRLGIKDVVRLTHEGRAEEMFELMIACNTPKIEQEIARDIVVWCVDRKLHQ